MIDKHEMQSSLNASIVSKSVDHCTSITEHESGGYRRSKSLWDIDNSIHLKRRQPSFMGSVLSFAGTESESQRKRERAAVHFITNNLSAPCSTIVCNKSGFISVVVTIWVILFGIYQIHAFEKQYYSDTRRDVEHLASEVALILGRQLREG